MAWYRFEMRHGPGHQGTDVRFLYYDPPLKKKDLDEQWNEIAEGRVRDHGFGELVLVEGLHPEVIEALRKKYRRQAQNADAMLRILEEHDAKLIEAWNRTVGPNDVVYHCGDFALVPRPRIAEIRKKLFGRIWLVLGNHDRSQTAMRDSGFATFAVAELEVDGRQIVLRHSPDDFTPEELERAALLLHGHWHGDDHRDQSGVPVEYRSKLVDVGIDARRDIAPAPLDEFVRFKVRP